MNDSTTRVAPQSAGSPPTALESAGPPEAVSSPRAKARRVIARKFYPYLEKSGWLLSHTSGAPVDAGGKPVPWYRYAAIDFLAERANKTQKVFEFGCGNSTLWWADRVANVTAVEHHAGWAQRIAAIAPTNVSVMEVELVPDGEYCRTPLGCGGKFDVIIIDGRDRVNCALQCLPALASNGVIIWDDSMRGRYAHGLRFLVDHGFKRIRFTGLGPILADPGETSVLYREKNCFQI